ncbi:hypothetical protein E5C26_11870 [Serratia proteamaculans]|nr:hypothetical protein E5C26_11870 [Serratia proteamaculans]
MTKWSFNPRYPGLAYRGALRRTSRYDPIGTLSLITGFVSSLKRQNGPLRRLTTSSAVYGRGAACCAQSPNQQVKSG